METNYFDKEAINEVYKSSLPNKEEVYKFVMDTSTYEGLEHLIDTDKSILKLTCNCHIITNVYWVITLLFLYTGAIIQVLLIEHVFVIHYLFLLTIICVLVHFLIYQLCTLYVYKRSCKRYINELIKLYTLINTRKG